MSLELHGSWSSFLAQLDILGVARTWPPDASYWAPRGRFPAIIAARISQVSVRFESGGYCASQQKLAPVTYGSFASKAARPSVHALPLLPSKADVNSPPWLPPLSANSRPEQVQYTEQASSVGRHV
jgi:hypothetical protein